MAAGRGCTPIALVLISQMAQRCQEALLSEPYCRGVTQHANMNLHEEKVVGSTIYESMRLSGDRQELSLCAPSALKKLLGQGQLLCVAVRRGCC